MSYPIPIGGIIQTAWIGSVFGQTVMTVMNWKNTGTSVSNGGATLAQVTDWMQGGTVGTAYLAAMSSDYSAVRTQAQFISPTRYRPVEQPWTGVGVGAQSKTPNVSVALERYGETASRASLGTLHIPAVPIDRYNNGMLVDASVITYTNLLAFWIAPQSMGTSTSWTPVLNHRANPTLGVIVVNGLVQRTIRVERRRTVGVGI